MKKLITLTLLLSSGLTYSSEPINNNACDFVCPGGTKEINQVEKARNSQGIIKTKVCEFPQTQEYSNEYIDISCYHINKKSYLLYHHVNFHDLIKHHDFSFSPKEMQNHHLEHEYVQYPLKGISISRNFKLQNSMNQIAYDTQKDDMNYITANWEGKKLECHLKTKNYLSHHLLASNTSSKIRQQLKNLFNDVFLSNAHLLNDQQKSIINSDLQHAYYDLPDAFMLAEIDGDYQEGIFTPSADFELNLLPQLGIREGDIKESFKARDYSVILHANQESDGYKTVFKGKKQSINAADVKPDSLLRVCHQLVKQSRSELGLVP